jgi:hypothetical protein
VSEPSQSTPPPLERVGAAGDGEAEGVRQPDALPVLAGSLHVMPARSGGSALPEERRPVIPAVQAAAVAAGSFVAGAAVVGLVHRRRRRAGALVKGRRAGRSRTAELVQIVSSRSLLVDVHLLGGPDER